MCPGTMYTFMSHGDKMCCVTVDVSGSVIAVIM
jgi:hypothetical protein